MEKGDIGVTIHKHVACWFEGLLVTPEPEPVEEKKGLLKRWFGKDEPIVDDDDWRASIVNKWRVNEMPLRSVIHLQEQLGIGVEVYTYYDDSMKDTIEHYLARKGANVQVYCYGDVRHLAEDMKYNRDVHTLFTPYEDDARVIGWHRATVVNPDGTFGF